MTEPPCGISNVAVCLLVTPQPMIALQLHVYIGSGEAACHEGLEARYLVHVCGRPTFKRVFIRHTQQRCPPGMEVDGAFKGLATRFDYDGAGVHTSALSLTRQFQMSTHCQPPSLGVRYGTRGTPIGIIRVTCRRGPLALVLQLATAPCVRRQKSSDVLIAEDAGKRAARQRVAQVFMPLIFKRTRTMAAGCSTARLRLMEIGLTC